MINSCPYQTQVFFPIIHPFWMELEIHSLVVICMKTLAWWIYLCWFVFLHSFVHFLFRKILLDWNNKQWPPGRTVARVIRREVWSEACLSRWSGVVCTRGRPLNLSKSSASLTYTAELMCKVMKIQRQIRKQHKYQKIRKCPVLREVVHSICHRRNSGMVQEWEGGQT